MRPTRKQFLRMGVAALAAGVRPARAAAPGLRVVVVGAGLSGLTAARGLVQAGAAEVVVLEARDRVGGRTVNLELPGGHVVEGGGEWIGPTQTRIAALAAELGVGTFPAYYTGDTTYDLGGVVSRGLLPDVGARELADFAAIAWKLDRMSRDVPRGAPWDAPGAAALDATTLGAWLHDQGARPTTRDVFRLITRAIMAGYPERISLLWFLGYLSSAGGLLPLILNDGGAQDQRFVGGSQRVSLQLHAWLGDRVRLGHPVRRIVDRPGGEVEVHAGDTVFSADRVVVAMMPADALRIRFDPELPPARRELAAGWARLTRLPIVKVSVAYPAPFWRDAGLNGAMQSDRAPLQLVFDNSPPDASIGVLSAFLSVAEAPHLADRDARERGVVDELARYFGDAARAPLAYVEKDWATDPWSTGCINPVGPGLLTRAGASLREPVGRIHWAGTETARVWAGFMDGAVRAGERAADEVIASW